MAEDANVALQPLFMASTNGSPTFRGASRRFGRRVDAMATEIRSTSASIDSAAAVGETDGQRVVLAGGARRGRREVGWTGGGWVSMRGAPGDDGATTAGGGRQLRRQRQQATIVDLVVVIVTVGDRNGQRPTPARIRSSPNRFTVV